MRDQVFEFIEKEKRRQLDGIELIASENFVSDQVMEAVGSVLTNKYAEGLPGKRYYGGCEFVDEVENLARNRAKQLFGAEWVNVQPHSGAQANTAVMLATLKPGDTVLGFDLSHGGHLSHGSPVNISGKYFRATFYGVEEETGTIDYDRVRETALREKPKLMICGASAYARDWDYQTLRGIADEVGAVLLGDIAPPAGLIASKLLNNPIPHCHIVTTTTHKTLRGPRGGMIMVGKNSGNPMGILNKKGVLRKLGGLLDSAVFPGSQGGPLMHVIAGKAVAFGEALQPEFTVYCEQVIRNAQALANHLLKKGYHLISGGTDNHLVLIDLRNKGLTGKVAEEVLEHSGITCNKNMVPFDTESPFVTSGIRLGTPAITTRGFLEEDMAFIANKIDSVLCAPNDTELHRATAEEIRQKMSDYPLFAEPVQA